MSNASKLKKMDQTIVVHNMKNCSYIAAQAWEKTLSKIYPNYYEDLNPQNKVLFYGIFFNQLFSEYMTFLNIKFDDIQLRIIANQHHTLPTIDVTEYRNMPKRYRGVFTLTDSDTYSLRLPNESRPAITFKETDKGKLETLLDYARKLIPVIYKTKWIDPTEGKGIKEPDFYKNFSLSAYFVQDKQMFAIDELNKTFKKIDDITKTYKTTIAINKHRHGATDIYNEYRNELTNKNRYLNAQKALTETQKTETNGLKELLNHVDEKDRSGIQTLIEYANRNPEKIRRQIIANLKSLMK